MTVENPITKAVGDLQKVILADRYPTGRRADLRRLDPAVPTGTEFWRLLLEHVPENLRSTPDQETKWALLIKGMACIGPGFDSQTFGEALAKLSGGISERRLEQWLSSRDETFDALFIAFCQQLSTKGLSVDWTRSIPDVVFGENGRRKRGIQGIARGFFSAQYRASKAAPAAKAG